MLQTTIESTDNMTLSSQANENKKNQDISSDVGDNNCCSSIDRSIKNLLNVANLAKSKKSDLTKYKKTILTKSKKSDLAKSKKSILTKSKKSDLAKS